MIGSGLSYKLGISECRSAEHDAIDAERQPMLDRSAIANPATELHSQTDSTADRRHRCTVQRAPRDRAVEVDDVQPGEAGIGELPSLRRGIAVEDRGGCHIAADEAHANAVLEVDRREQNHGAAAWSSRSL